MSNASHTVFKTISNSLFDALLLCVEIGHSKTTENVRNVIFIDFITIAVIFVLWRFVFFMNFGRKLCYRVYDSFERTHSKQCVTVYFAGSRAHKTRNPLTNDRASDSVRGRRRNSFLLNAVQSDATDRGETTDDRHRAKSFASRTARTSITGRAPRNRH